MFNDKLTLNPGTAKVIDRGEIVMDVEDPYEASGGRTAETDRVSEGIREAGSYLHKRGQESRDARTHDFTTQQRYQYPTVPTREGTMQWDTAPLQPRNSSLSYDQPPARPALATLAHLPPSNLPTTTIASPDLAPPATADPAPSAPPPPPPSIFANDSAIYGY